MFCITIFLLAMPRWLLTTAFQRLMLLTILLCYLLKRRNGTVPAQFLVLIGLLRVNEHSTQQFTAMRLTCHALQTLCDQLKSRLAASDALSMQLQHALMDGQSSLYYAAPLGDTLAVTPAEPAEDSQSPVSGGSSPTSQSGSGRAAQDGAGIPDGQLADITNAALPEPPAKRGSPAKRPQNVGTARPEAGLAAQLHTARESAQNPVAQLDGSLRVHLEEWRDTAEAAIGSLRGHLEETAADQQGGLHVCARRAVEALEGALQQDLRAAAHFEGLLEARDTECAQLRAESSRHETAARQLLRHLETKQAAQLEQHAQLESLYAENRSMLQALESLVCTVGERDATIQSLTAELGRSPQETPQVRALAELASLSVTALTASSSNALLRTVFAYRRML